MIIIQDGKRRVHYARLVSWMISDTRRAISRAEETVRLLGESLDNEGAAQSEIIIWELDQAREEKRALKAALRDLLAGR